jgi:hypothetical protein
LLRGFSFFLDPVAALRADVELLHLDVIPHARFLQRLLKKTPFLKSRIVANTRQPRAARLTAVA